MINYEELEERLVIVGEAAPWRVELDDGTAHTWFLAEKNGRLFARLAVGAYTVAELEADADGATAAKRYTARSNDGATKLAHDAELTLVVRAEPLPQTDGPRINGYRRPDTHE